MNQRILLVDDEPSSTTMKANLEMNGFEVVTARFICLKPSFGSKRTAAG